MMPAMELPITNSGRILNLGAGMTQQIKQILIRYCGESEVRYAALLEESGTVCADAGDPAFRDSGETAALAVGAFAALQAVAGRLGDTTFEGFFHEGRTRQFCLMPVTPQFLLLSVFQAPVRFAIVKICAAKATTRLLQQIECMPVEARHIQPLTTESDSGTGAWDFTRATALFSEGQS
jgi:hypothetical protein